MQKKFTLPALPSCEGYRLFRAQEGAIVRRSDGSSLPVKLNEVSHSPDGFEWGYGGSGPSQLAYALLRDRGVPEKLAKALYQRYKNDVIAVFDHGGGFISSASIADWVVAAAAELVS